MIKVATVDKHGHESLPPMELPVNEHGYVLLPDVADVVVYRLYSAFPGFEETGPWYFSKAVKRNYAKSVRFTIAAPESVPVPRDCWWLHLPELSGHVPVRGQTGWAIVSPHSGLASCIVNV